MAVAFPGDAERFFFRKDEQEYLLERLKYPGITVIKGRPRAGKTWLVGRVLSQVQQGCQDTLIGYCRCSAQDADNLLRAVEDLYTRWREGASYLEQATRLLDQNKGRWPQAIAGAVAKVVDAAKPFDAGSGIVSDALRGLLDLERGSQVSRLKYEQGQQLVDALARIAQAKRVVLALDQWEQSESLCFELEHLRNFIQDSEGWPQTHFLLTIRLGGEPERLLDGLCAGQVDFAEPYELPLFDIQGDAQERDRLITYLHGVVPACRAVPDADEYLDSIQGYAAVLDNWTRAVNRDRMTGLEDLREVAREAQKGRYPEFEQRVPELDEPARRLCLRLALLPDTTGDSWPSQRPVIMDGIPAACLDDLRQKQLLEQTDPPGFGHRSRAEFVRDWLIENRRAETSEQWAWLVRRLAARVRDVSPAAAPYAAGLASLSEFAQRLQTDPVSEALCESAVSLFGVHVNGKPLLAASAKLRAAESAEVAILAAMGLFNTLNHAKAEDDLERRDALLDELRALARDHPGEPAVRERLASGLFNTLNHAKAEDDLERRDALLDELRALARDHPGEPAVREPLAQGLVNTLVDAKAEDNLERRDALLEELRALARDHPGEPAVREWLASGLHNTLVDAKAEDDLVRRDALLEELRALARDHPGEPAVHEQLAKGLFNTLNYAKAEDNLVRRDALLDELRALARDYPGEPAVRERLAQGLHNTLVDAKNEGDLVRRDALLDELRELAAAQVEDVDLQAVTAKGLTVVAVQLTGEGRDDDIPSLLREIEARLAAVPDGHPVKQALSSAGLLADDEPPGQDD